MLKNLFINSNRISYFDQNEAADKAIIFVHGNSLNLHSFKHQLNSPALEAYRLVALDLPGHGDSFRNTSYNVPEFSALLSSFVSELNITDYILVGHSLGGHVVLESLDSLTPSGVMIIGTPPVTIPLQAGMFHPHPAMELLYKGNLSDGEVLQILRAFDSTRELTSNDITLFRKTDPAFAGLFAEGLSQSLFKDEVKLMEKYTGKKSVVLGESDPLVGREYIEMNTQPGELVIIPGGHSVHSENPAAFNKHLFDFAQQCFQTLYPHLSSEPVVSYV